MKGSVSRPLRRAIALLTAVCVAAAGPLAGTGCVPTNASPLGTAGEPFAERSDEAALAVQSDRIDDWMVELGATHDDPALLEHVRAIVARVTPPGLEKAGLSADAYVIEETTPNAAALANGSIYFSTGLLALLENDAQLATVAAHELAHVEQRHLLETYRSSKNRQNLKSVGTVAVGLIGFLLTGLAGGAIAAGLTSGGIDLWNTVAVTGYARGLELEADRRGFEILSNAGYDLDEAPRVFALLDAHAEETGLRPTTFLSTHPALEDRHKHYTKLIGRHAARRGSTEGDSAPAEYRQAVRHLYLVNFHAALEEADVASAERWLTRDREENGETADYFLAAAHVAKLTGQGDRAAAALALYERAAELEPRRPEAFREIGLAHWRARREDEARAAFERYLKLSPDAVDAPIVRARLEAR